MTNEFTREARYAVLKSADVMQCLTVNELIALRRIEAKVGEYRAEIGKPPLDCAVVESDWPEYEPTWRAIEARVTGTQPSPAALVGARKVTRDFRWDSITQCHVPLLKVEFEPIPVEATSDAKGWRDQARIAAMLDDALAGAKGE